MQHHLEGAAGMASREKNAHALEDLDPTERGHLRNALAAYVYGDSSRVSSYTAVLNNNFFPLQAGAFTAILNVTVSTSKPWSSRATTTHSTSASSRSTRAARSSWRPIAP